MSSIELPPPGSVYRQIETNRQMRVVYSGTKEIVAHNAELADRLETIVSWVGTPEKFAKEFAPGDPNKFPQTAA